MTDSIICTISTVVLIFTAFTVAILLICSAVISKSFAQPKPKNAVFKVISSRAEKGKDGKVQIIHAAGTAFAIGKRSVITAAHNVLDRQSGVIYEDIKILTDQGWVQCSVSKQSHLDVCELKPASDIPACVLAKSDVDIGKKVALLGSASGAPVSRSEGKVVRRYHSDLVYTMAELKFDHGCSGGPVIHDGQVIGMVVAGVPDLDGKLDTGKCLYLPAQVIREFIADKIGGK